MMVAVILLLHPVFEEDGVLRVVATGVEEHDVVWSLDGVEVGRTTDRQALEIAVRAGAHNITATSAAQGPWQAVGRVDGVGDGAAFVPAWTAAHRPATSAATSLAPVDEPASAWPKLPLVLAGLALLLLVVPGRRGLEARRRRRRVED